MPVTTTYPGVYVEEIPSGVRTITGVATSITAFIGRAKRGPTDDPITINSYGDFERVFGGLWADSTLGYAVRDFYLNGGSQAIVVRLYHPKFASTADRDKAAQAANDTAAAATGADAAAAANAAQTKADTYTVEPEKTAAKYVADAADRASKAGATVAGVKKAADTAAAAEAGNQAALDTAAATTGPDAATAAANAKAKADTYTTDPDKTAAKKVADAADQASKAGATVGDVHDAATASTLTAAPRTKARLSVGGLNLEAAYEGSWGNDLSATVDHEVAGPDAAVLFNLTVRDTRTERTEVFRNVSVSPGHARQVDKVLASESRLARSDLPGSRPSTGTATVASGDEASDGGLLTTDDFILNKEDRKQGLYTLQKADIFNILCIPPYLACGDVDYLGLIDKAAQYCEKRRAILLVDPPAGWGDKAAAVAGTRGQKLGTNNKNATAFFPRLRQPDPMHDGRPADFVPCGAVAGVFARTDTNRGVWKAPAGLEATLVGVPELSVPLTDLENGELNQLGVNCLRAFPAAGRVVWGSRTLQGDDRLASEWKYIPVRRTALYIEESLYRGTQWVVFEPNDEPLWAQIRLNLGAFMHNLFRQGAFQGKTPQEAYFVKCDKETTTPNDVNLGIVNIIVGFAPLKPAEFVIIRVQQIAGQIQA
jgi:phage tail sheath protein FI